MTPQSARWDFLELKYGQSNFNPFNQVQWWDCGYGLIEKGEGDFVSTFVVQGSKLE